MGGRGRGKRGPHKPFAQTQRGVKALKKLENEQRRADKAREKADKRSLWEQGLCRDPDGNLTTFQMVGRKYGPVGGPLGHLGATSGHLGATSGHLGGQQGQESYEKASTLQKQLWAAEASIGGSAAWANHSSEKQSEIQQAGILGSINSADYPCRA